MNEYMHPNKVYVSVSADFSREGRIRPTSFIWEDGRRYEIDKVVDVRRAASLKAGGIGMRYTCMIQGKQTYLYLEDERWFMERKG